MAYHVRPLELNDPRRAELELSRVGADPAGVAKMRDKAGFLALRAVGLKSPAANILKQEMLSLGGDAAVGRWVVTCSEERSDAVILGTRKQMRALVRKLRPQPFGLKVLAGEIQQFLSTESHPRALSWPGGVLRLSERPHVMGILNVTPDSFSDGGDHLAPETALERALAMIAEGADIVDVGGESTRPGAEPVPAEEELRRVLPVIEHLAPRVPVPLSVDTVKPEVARTAAAAGASIVNDVSGLRADPGMAAAVAQAGCALVVMHMRGTPRTMQRDTRYADLVGDVLEGLEQSVDLAVAAGVPRDRVIVDPGLGFGKDVQGNLLLLRRLGELRGLGCPLLVGPSRKSFIGKVLGSEVPKDRLEGSLAAAVVAVCNGAHIVRAHDVAATRRAVELAWAVQRAAEG
ncbi:MAG: dihydropteroate synthase [Deferrisomatales bacterium]|nr:dihydropteroate synthase [Deferrisomatales bacterium]